MEWKCKNEIENIKQNYKTKQKYVNDPNKLVLLPDTIGTQKVPSVCVKMCAVDGILKSLRKCMMWWMHNVINQVLAKGEKWKTNTTQMWKVKMWDEWRANQIWQCMNSVMCKVRWYGSKEVIVYLVLWHNPCRLYEVYRACWLTETRLRLFGKKCRLSWPAWKFYLIVNIWSLI